MKARCPFLQAPALESLSGGAPHHCFLGALATAASALDGAAGVSQPLPDLGVSLLRILGALALVIGIFLIAVWLLRNWQRLVVQRGRSPRLNVIETRSLGGRHALHVVAYEQERFLITSSPAGVSLLSCLPPADEASPAKPLAAPAPSFAQSLAAVLRGK